MNKTLVTSCLFILCLLFESDCWALELKSLGKFQQLNLSNTGSAEFPVLLDCTGLKLSVIHTGAKDTYWTLKARTNVEGLEKHSLYIYIRVAKCNSAPNFLTGDNKFIRLSDKIQSILSGKGDALEIPLQLRIEQICPSTKPGTYNANIFFELEGAQ